MKCPNCQRENEPTSRFCIFCGALLPAPEAGRSSESAETPADASLRQLQAVKEEMHRLRESVELMNNRLAALERTQGISAPTPEPTPAPPSY